MSVEINVKTRYAEGANEVQPALCCPVDYDASLLKMLPQEIIDRDYGCGDPSRYVKEGDTVLDLGSGGGKICYMAAQLVGDEGAVIGVDMTDDMLALARSHQAEMATKLGKDLVDFRKGYIQDLALNVGEMEKYLAENPISDANGLAALDGWKKQQRKTTPLVASESVDLVVSNCVLNLVGEGDRQQMIDEIFRVLKPGGRVAISDIVSDEVVPQHLQDDEELWSGCISGAYHEEEFLDAFLDAGFMGVAYDKWDAAAWQVVEGIEFRSVTLTATKPVTDECMEIGQALIYKGPYSEVYDDDGHEFPRGKRMAVCQRTYDFMTSGIYADDFIGINPATPRKPRTWCAPAGTVRPASETKGGEHSSATSDGGCC